MTFLDERKPSAKPRDERESFLRTLETSPIGFGICLRTEAADIWDNVEAMRADWLRRKNRRLPHPDAIERARYPRPRWEGSSRG